MAIHEGNAANFASLTNNPGKLVVVDYWADWCSPCKQLAPILDELAAEYNDRLDVVKVNTGDQTDLAAQRGIMSLPTLEFYSGGQLVKTTQGGQTKRQLIKIIDSLT
ncbi:MAG: thioredoxin [Propionibacteriaceae bacterium]|nr:thioredoxin [Propionibacteriaceae bacterium]